MTANARAIFLSLCVCLSAISQISPQCRISFPEVIKDKANFLSPGQEMDLGDAIAEYIQPQLVSASTSAPDSWLQKTAERLVRSAPLAGVRIRTFLIDMPEANAFVLPGGRIYVSRSLIAFARSEDELSGLLAHELGHLVAHHSATDIARRMHSLLGIDDVGDRRDVFNKFHEFVERPDFENSGKAEQHENAQQVQADRFGLLMQAAAGFDPEALVQAFDRLAETKGKTGTFLSDLFGATPPESKRLREMLRSLPQGCGLTTTHTDSAEFTAWRTAVLKGARAESAESLHDVIARRRMEPPLRGDLEQLRFSGDGQYVIAQDNSGVNVLSVNPLQDLFRIPAADASLAQFTPDSTEVVLLAADTRVERWNIANRQRVDLTEIPIRRPCLARKLAPDGRMLACLSSDGSLSLIDIASGDAVLEKKDFTTGFSLLVLVLLARAGEPAFTRMDFSPDGRYFVALSGDASEAPIAWDLRERGKISLGGALRGLSSASFVFAGADRIVVPNGDKSELISFPSGLVLAKSSLPGGDITRAADSNFVFVRPLGKLAVGCADMRVNQAVLTGKLAAMDRLGQVYVAERLTGEVALYEVGKGVRATVQLPEPELTAVHTAALSPDLSWAAISEKTRGAVWNVSTGAITVVRGFQGSFFENNEHVVLDMPKLEPQERHLVEIDLVKRASTSSPDVKDGLATQRGPYLWATRTKGGKPPTFVTTEQWFEDIVYDVRDPHTLNTVWSRAFPKEAPAVFTEVSANSCVFIWPWRAKAAQELVKKDPSLKSRLPREDRRQGLHLAEIVDVRTGGTKKLVLFDLVNPEFVVRDGVSMSDHLVIADDQNRITVYAESTGEPGARFFGSLLASDPVHQRLAIGKERGHLVVVSAVSGDEITDFTVAGGLPVVRFSSDGNALFLLTSNEEGITVALH